MKHLLVFAAYPLKCVVQRWDEKEREEMETHVVAALRQIAGHCSRKDVERWPVLVTAFLELAPPATDSLPQPEVERVGVQNIDGSVFDR
jgi:hypothetical protein